MHGHRYLLILAICTLAACSKAPPPVAGAAAKAPASSASTSVPASACDRKLVTIEDAVGILDAPVTATKNIPGDPQSCVFDTASYPSLTVTIRPGHGQAAVGMYTSGKMDQFDKSAPLAGVGSEAVRSLALDRVIARKDDLLCEITGPGLANATDDSKARKLGALCNKIFAAY
jgi:hypothetical protein